MVLFQERRETPFLFPNCISSSEKSQDMAPRREYVRRNAGENVEQETQQAPQETHLEVPHVPINPLVKQVTNPEL
uniref:Uncharacterized protein n=1 Tax=Solanum tuberosum TaxID=4113 RepID=M1DL67_SOLTU